MSYINGNPTTEEVYGEDVKIKIVRVSPFLNGVEVECRNYVPEWTYIRLTIKELESGKTVFEKIEYCNVDVLRAERLATNIDYLAEITVCNKNMEEIACSSPRLFRCGLFPGTVIDYIHPGDVTYMRSGEFVGSPYIVKLDNGSYITSHDVFSHVAAGNEALCRFFVSKDYGKNWRFLSEIEQCTWGTMFERNGVLYIVGCTASGNGDLVLYYSKDCGNTWSEPQILARKDDEIYYRCAPTAYAEAGGRLWICIAKFKNGRNGLAVISAEVDADLKEPDSWTVSDAEYYNPEWNGAVPEWTGIMIEEGNVIIAPDGEIKIIARCNSHRFDTPVPKPDNIRAYILKVDKDNPAAKPEFEKTIPFNGSLHKFYIQYDMDAQRYVGLVNRMTTNQIWQRNVLSLVSSKDLNTWQIERDLINLEDINWSEDAWKCGVQYPTFFLEENEIVAVVRTAINGADSFHNANAMTFHRFKEINDKYRF
ncbi:MAG: exo-alpha-sialidase [Clostridia bacterium]|nr:exo-alpha-sialidase [Clostridia bacterium]